MGESDSDKDPQKENAPDDEELESLSEEEKAAFEKIMAEIASTTGGPSEDESAGPDRESRTVGDHRAQEDTTASGVPPSDDRAASGDDAQERLQPADEKKPASKQAALDQLTADIEARKGGDDSGDEPDLPQDQQAALDQILSEIETKRKGEKIDSDRTAGEAIQAEEDLSSDQQAALDQILSEIETKRKGEKKTADPAPSAGEDGAELSSEQQDALDQIMADIESKRAGAKTSAETSAREEEESAQANVEKIMTEIEAKKAREPKGPLEASSGDPEMESEPTGADEAKQEAKAGLTLEEFDDELSNLLSEGQAEAAPTKVRQPKESPAVADRTASADADSKAEDTAKNALPDATTPPSNEDVETHPDYPTLHELHAESDAPKTASKQKVDRKSETGGPGGLLRRRALAFGLIAVLSLAVLGTGSYWVYRHIAVKSEKTDAHNSPMALQQQAKPPVSTQVHKTAGIDRPKVPSTPEASAPIKQTPPLETPAAILAGLMQDLSASRNRIQKKIQDIEELKSYYNRGVDEDTQKIEEMLPNGTIPSLKNALANREIKLQLRSIQRRKTYAARLEMPLTRLKAISEELLYLKRRADIYQILNGGIGGLPLDKFKKNVTGTISRNMQYYSNISIDHADVQSPSLAVIWEHLVDEFRQEASRLAEHAPLNRAISAEICKGNYERKYLLTALSAETARCLAKWPGKDMNLNELSDLSPQAAKILVKWPGDWLSLNGLKKLSPETARYLSQWPGQRLSLNGLIALSPEATEYLSQWHGAQLEMVGLRSIGPWKNYGTRLFLSEELQRQLEAQ